MQKRTNFLIDFARQLISFPRYKRLHPSYGRHSGRLAIPRYYFHVGRGQIHFVPSILFGLLAGIFGFALFVATGSILALVAIANSWLWWGALLPLAIAHWVSGFLVTWSGSMQNTMACAITSAGTTILTIIAAAWLAHGVGLEMPRHVAVTVLIAASIAGLGLAFVAWLWLGGGRSPSLISEK